MSIAIAGTIQALQVVLQTVPIGTNLALLQLLWRIVSGSFVPSRGAIVPGLQLSGFSKDESRRSWTAMRYGVLRIDDLLTSWRSYVKGQGRWVGHDYEGYQPVAADITAFWRLRLKGWAGKYFNQLTNRLLGVASEITAGQAQRQWQAAHKFGNPACGRLIAGVGAGPLLQQHNGGDRRQGGDVPETFLGVVVQAAGVNSHP